jgi:beta-lactam-binding protein with PASTA domain
VTIGPASASVPTVVGLRQANAMQALQSLGYCIEVVNQASAVAPPGVVIRMSPPPGTLLALGGTVEVTISTGPERPVCIRTAPSTWPYGRDDSSVQA